MLNNVKPTNEAKLWTDYPEDGSPMIEYALCYAMHGMPVFPIRPRTKTGFFCYPEHKGKPSTKFPEGTPYSWQAQASTDIDRVKKFWTDHPDANIGFATGNGYGIDDLDREHVNVNKETGEKTLITDGWERYRQWEKETGIKLNTETVMSLTGNGGNQLFYRYDPSRSLKGDSDIFNDNSGCDTRGDGNYVLLPPSIHPNGSQYTWEQPPSEYPFLEADEAFYQFWKGSSSKTEPSSNVPFDPSMKVTSNRHKYMTRYCSWILTKFPDLKQSEYEDMLRKKNDEDLFPPLGKNHDDKTDELESTIFPFIPKLMIKDGTRRREKEEEAERFHSSIVKDESYWNSLYETMDDQNSENRTESQTEKKQFKPIKTADQLDTTPIEWLVPRWIPKRGISILGSDGGTGKTFIWISILASLSRGESTVLRYDPELKKGMKVLCFSGEDPENILRTRLENSGADMSNIHVIAADTDLSDDLGEGKSLTVDCIEYLEWALKTYKPQIIVFDPLQSFLPASVDMSRRNHMRQALNPLNILSSKYNCSVLISMHTNKRENASGRNKLADSSDVWDLARSVLMSGFTANKEERYISLEKSSYATLNTPSILYNITEEGKFTFIGYSDNKMEDFVRERADLHRKESGFSGDGKTLKEECCDAILELLKDNNGRMDSSEMSKVLKEEFKDATIKKAKIELRKNGFIDYDKYSTGKNDVIRLPKQVDTDNEDNEA